MPLHDSLGLLLQQEVQGFAAEAGSISLGFTTLNTTLQDFAANFSASLVSTENSIKMQIDQLNIQIQALQIQIAQFVYCISYSIDRQD